ncbi:MAG: outer membrane protein assembly factor BamD [Chlamydiia bacterium]|nr:outer membrane protein assembly factor BamD [Chlamydiia bacterium]
MRIPLTFIALSLAVSNVHAAYTIQDGKLINADRVATLSCDDHYQIATNAYLAEDWDVAATQFDIIHTSFPKTPMGQESPFFKGVCLYEREEYEFANEAFNDYLKSSAQPQFFAEAMDYKFAIANQFAGGARRRCFGTKQLPKILPAKNLAVEIYDEIIQTMPCHDYAAEALWAKGNMYWEEGAYSESIDNFQMLIRRFPKHELTPQAYVAINQVYRTEAEWEFQNPDLLQLAELNLRRFETDFPRDERLEQAKIDLIALKETYASGLWTTGNYYEGQGAPKAAVIYYLNALKKFPETQVAEKCRARLESLQHVEL